MKMIVFFCRILIQPSTTDLTFETHKDRMYPIGQEETKSLNYKESRLTKLLALLEKQINPYNQKEKTRCQHSTPSQGKA